MFGIGKSAGLACWLALAAGAAGAAGGHHDVDDAAILPPGACEQESWFGRADGGRQRLHAGLNCRAGPVELGVAGEHRRKGGLPAETFWGLEAKWARELAGGLAVGLALQPAPASSWPRAGPRP